MRKTCSGGHEGHATESGHGSRPGRPGLLTAFTAAFCSIGSLALSAPLPNGASSLSETYEDWQVNCSAQKDVVQCAMVQSQVNQQSNQRVLGVEFGPDGKSGLSGTLVLPFGLMLAGGVTMQIGETGTPAQSSFLTCLPGGCVVPLPLDEAASKQAEAADRIQLSATVAATGEPAKFSISLKGFASARARLADLTK